MALYHYKMPIIMKKNLHSVLVNLGKTTKYFPGLINKNQGLSRTFQDSKKNSGLSQDLATLHVMYLLLQKINFCFALVLFSRLANKQFRVVFGKWGGSGMRYSFGLGWEKNNLSLQRGNRHQCTCT